MGTDGIATFGTRLSIDGPLGRVTLLLVNQLVRFQNLGDPIAIRVDLRLGRPLTSLRAGRAGVRRKESGKMGF